MKKSSKFAISLTVVFFLSLFLSLLPRTAKAEKFMEEFKSVISKDAIKVGESAMVTFQGKQLDAREPISFGSVGDEFASVVKVTQVDPKKFKVPGLAPGKAVLKFKCGDKEAVVKVTVVVGGLN
jgi:hypothetical protein